MALLGLVACAVCSVVHLGGAPVAVATGPGAVWVLTGSARGEVVLRIDPRTSHVVKTVRIGPTGYENGALAVGHGDVWAGAGPRLVRLRPGTGRVVTTLRVGGFVTAVALAGSDVWVADVAQNGPGEVVRVDAATARVKARIRVGDGPVSVVSGLGSIWVANSSASSVMRIDPRTDRVTATLLSDRFSSDLTVAAGLVWVAGDVDLIGLDSSGRIARRISLPTRATRVAVRGSVAFALDDCACSHGRTFRIDLLRRRVTATFTVGMTPVDIAAGASDVWVADYGDSALERIAVS